MTTWLGRAAWVLALASLGLGGTDAWAQAPAGRDYVKDPLQLLLDCQAAQEKVPGYTAIFTKHENIGGQLREQETMFQKCRYAPLSIYLKWVKNPKKDREVIYVQGKNDGKVLGHQPIGPMNFEAKSDPESPDAKKESLRPITQSGLLTATQLLVQVATEAKAAGDLQMFCIDNASFDNRPCWLLIRVLPKKGGYPAFINCAHVDKELMTPVRIVTFDWDDELIASYTYTNVKLNVKLTDADFDRENKNYNWPFIPFFGKFRLGDDKKN